MAINAVGMRGPRPLPNATSATVYGTIWPEHAVELWHEVPTYIQAGQWNRLELTAKAWKNGGKPGLKRAMREIFPASWSSKSSPAHCSETKPTSK